LRFRAPPIVSFHGLREVAFPTPRVLVVRRDGPVQNSRVARGIDVNGLRLTASEVESFTLLEDEETRLKALRDVAWADRSDLLAPGKALMSTSVELQNATAEYENAKTRMEELRRGSASPHEFDVAREKEKSTRRRHEEAQREHGRVARDLKKLEEWNQR